MSATLYQISPDGCALMNCYVIKTESGKIIVIDGGGIDTREKTLGYLYGELQKISGMNEPVIDAWFLSHLHQDHVTEFIIIGENRDLPITVKNIYFNFPSRNFFKASENGASEFLYPRVANAYNRFKGEGAFERAGGKTAFENDSFCIDGLTIDILCVCNDEENEANINDTSIIFRITAYDQTFLFLGDAHIAQGNKLLKKYGKKIHSDVVQMSHHGQSGVSKEVYEAIAPTLCLWPSPDWVFDNWNGNLQTFETRNWLSHMGVKYHIVTGRHKTQSLLLPIDFSKLKEENISHQVE